jgi:hypothetical protein
LLLVPEGDLRADRGREAGGVRLRGWIGGESLLRSGWRREPGARRSGAREV